MGIGPFVGGKSGHYPNGDGDQDVGNQNVQPYLQGQRIHETEQAGGPTFGGLKTVMAK